MTNVSNTARARVILAAASIAFPSAFAMPALADVGAGDPAFCAERPGQTTPPCVIKSGAAMVEVGISTWEHSTSGSERDDELALGATTLRYGLARRVEVQVGWAGLVRSSHVDGKIRTGSHSTNPGDLSLAALYGIAGSDGPVAIQAYVTLPTGRGEATAGDWSGGVRLPVAVQLNGDWQLGLTPEFDLATNASGHGRHSAYGGAAGVARAISSNLSVGMDVSVIKDIDPEAKNTQAMASASLAWQVDRDTQLDIGTGVGLTATSPQVQVYFGIAKRLK